MGMSEEQEEVGRTKEGVEKREARREIGEKSGKRRQHVAISQEVPFGETQ